MHGLTTSPLSYLLLALFALHVAAASDIANANANGMRLDTRQSSGISCQDYATLANLSVIAGNSTFRAKFIQASPDGTEQSESILTNALNQYTDQALINDTALNDQCGNLTTVAIAAAPTNFSEGIIGPFTFSEGARLGGGSGMTAIVTAAILGTAVLLL